MFTGLVEQIGQLSGRAPRGPGARVVIRTTLTDIALGDSIAVDGVCLTVDTLTPGGFEADASNETLARTTLGTLPIGADVNLERALAVGQRMGGHIVSGHVDGVGRAVEASTAGDTVKMAFSAPKELLRFIAEKGSITVSGVSLTVNGTLVDGFHVMLIPHTLKKTSLARLRPGDAVNLEVDLLARYVARLIEVGREADPGDANAQWLARLERTGFVS